MKTNSFFAVLSFLFLSTSAFAQYTEVINSNRPGASIGAFSVGKNVIQFEGGMFVEQQDHKKLNTEVQAFGLDFALRYGLFKEQLEISWEGSYQFDTFTSNATNPAQEFNRNGFLSHTIGAKYMVYDPYIKSSQEKPNLLSWKANNSFRWKDLIPAIGVYVGANFIFSDNPYFPATEPSVSPKVTLATQSHFAGSWVFVSNITYNRITSDSKELSYTLSLTHAFDNPKWSAFVEHQGIDSDQYADALFRAGSAYLLGDDFQLDGGIGASVKNTPTRLFASIGISYRFDDWHVDELIPIDEQDPKGEDPKKKKDEDEDEDDGDDNN
ncbi:transporter [Kordia sp. YSTF-M3]|uniref:Transporter n=1 Tax=Kordia aestuariivivens TaxID=2759037 RepID=A0ABR7QFQ7_9FLAO|nr:transporter [Kordia aestuariivivens]MBC8757409.1 transporter [Kordia aestuariivivens]